MKNSVRAIDIFFCCLILALSLCAAKTVDLYFHIRFYVFAEVVIATFAITVYCILSYASTEGKDYLRQNGYGIYAPTHLRPGIYYGQYTGVLGTKAGKRLFDLIPAKICVSEKSGEWNGTWSYDDSGNYDVRGYISDEIREIIRDEKHPRYSEITDGCYFNWTNEKGQWELQLHPCSKQIVSNKKDSEKQLADSATTSVVPSTDHAI